MHENPLAQIVQQQLYEDGEITGLQKQTNK